MKHLLAFLLLLCSASVSAQDVIVKKDGSTILSKVLEVGQEEIKYKKYDNLEGPTYTISKSELQAINYKNGAKDTFSAPVREENKYLPNNQNDGEQRMNDRALLALDFETENPYLKKAKSLQTIGWIGGAALLGVGGVIQILAPREDGKETERRIIGGIIMGGGVVWATGFFITSKYYKKQANTIQFSSIYQHKFVFPNGSSFSTGIDMLSDRSMGSNTLGLGLRYNF